jgi:hypothetical protein
VKLTALIGWRLVGFVLACCALELYLWSFTTYGQLVVTERSERYGWRMLPSQSRWSREGDVREVINARGYRDREWDAPRFAGDAWEKDPSVLRVAVLGNSMTYGTSVPIEQVWTRALEDRLARDLAAHGDPRTALVMNFAVQGYVLEQMQAVFEDDVRPYRPDVLIVPLHVGDVLPMGPALGEPDLRYRRPWFRTATRDLLFRDAVGKWIPLPSPPPGAAPPDVGGIKDLLKRDLRNPALFRLWSEAGGRLNAMQQMVEADGGRLAVVILPTLEHLVAPEAQDASVQLAPWAESRNARPGAVPVVLISARAEFGAAQETLTRAIAALPPKPGEGSPVERLPQTDKAMRYLPPDLPGFDERLFLQQDVGHYSARGHRLLGDAVCEHGAAAGLWP